MKAKKALRKALEQPWLYNEEELKRLKSALDQAEDMGVQELWHRRTTQGFSNYPQELLQEKKTYSNPEPTENVSTERLPLQYQPV